MLFVNKLLGNMALTNEEVCLNNIVDILGNDVEFLIVSAKLTNLVYYSQGGLKTTMQACRQLLYGLQT